MATVGWYYTTFPTRGHFTVKLPHNDARTPEFTDLAPQLQKRSFVVVLAGWGLNQSRWGPRCDLGGVKCTALSASHVSVTHGDETLDFVFSADNVDIRVDFYPLASPFSVSADGTPTLRFGLLRGKARAVMTLSVTLTRAGHVVQGPHRCRTRLVAQQTTTKRPVAPSPSPAPAVKLTAANDGGDTASDDEADAEPAPRARVAPGTRPRPRPRPRPCAVRAASQSNGLFKATTTTTTTTLSPHAAGSVSPPARTLSRQLSGSYGRRRLQLADAVAPPPNVRVASMTECFPLHYLERRGSSNGGAWPWGVYDGDAAAWGVHHQLSSADFFMPTASATATTAPAPAAAPLDYVRLVDVAGDPDPDPDPDRAPFWV